jgi:hypothetical protein
LAAAATAERWQRRQHGNGGVCARASAAAQRRCQGGRVETPVGQQPGNVSGGSALAVAAGRRRQRSGSRVVLAAEEQQHKHGRGRARAAQRRRQGGGGGSRMTKSAAE